MKQNRLKLQQTSPYELEKGMHKIHDIIKRQQDKISQLLGKYDIRAQNPLDKQVSKYKNQIRTIQLGGSRTSRANSKVDRQHSAILNHRNLTQRKQIKIKLPNLVDHRIPGLKKGAPKRKKDTFDDYHIQIKGQLRRIYGRTRKSMYAIQQPIYSKKSRNGNGVSRKKSHSRFLYQSRSKSRQQNNETLQQNQQNQLPKSLINRNQKQQEQLSSEEDLEISEQTPLPVYWKNFRQKMRNQCLEQMNLLYFSRNESMKDWSQAFLSLFEKHDKQIVGSRKSANYLQKFDRQYFSIGILDD